MTSPLPPLPPVKRLSPSIWRILGGNPSKFTLQGTNTYLLGSGRQRILVDTAQGFPAWTENLRDALQQVSSRSEPQTDSSTGAETGTGTKIEITDCVLTHWHGDHVLGLRDLLALFPDCRIWKHSGSRCDPDSNLTRFHVRELHDGQILSLEDDRFNVRVVHTPGHTVDHVVLQIVSSRETDEVGALFTADNVLGHGTAVFEDLAVYIASLQKMLGALEGVSESLASASSPAGSADAATSSTSTIKAYPGHGEVIDDAAAKIKEYISHRAMRETEAMNVLLHGNTTGAAKTSQTDKQQETVTNTGNNESEAERDQDEQVKEWTSMAMVKVIYAGYPASLHAPAEGSLLQVLKKLEGEGRVSRTKDGRWRAVNSSSTTAGGAAGGGNSHNNGGGRL